MTTNKALPPPETILLIAFVALFATGCQTDSSFRVNWPDRPLLRSVQHLIRTSPEPIKILLVPHHFTINQVDWSGAETTRADLSQVALDNVLEAFAEKLRPARIEPIPLLEDSEELSDPELHQHAQLAQLVINVALIAKFSQMDRLPSKISRFDWTIGAEAASAFRERFGVDYALFFTINDSYAEQTAGARMFRDFLKGMGVHSLGGSQKGVIGLVDLRSGDLLWLNALRRNEQGDLRTLSTALETVNQLIQGMPQ